jgi:hypothetical protein
MFSSCASCSSSSAFDNGAVLEGPCWRRRLITTVDAVAVVMVVDDWVLPPMATSINRHRCQPQWPFFIRHDCGGAVGVCLIDQPWRWWLRPCRSSVAGRRVVILFSVACLSNEATTAPFTVAFPSSSCLPSRGTQDSGSNLSSLGASSCGPGTLCPIE